MLILKRLIFEHLKQNYSETAELMAQQIGRKYLFICTLGTNKISFDSEKKKFSGSKKNFKPVFLQFFFDERVCPGHLLDKFFSTITSAVSE